MVKENQNQFVAVIVRFGSVVGVYSNVQDAYQVLSDLTSKGQTCDLTIKPLL